MLPAALQVPTTVARRFLRRALLLDSPVASVAEVLAHHGYIQIDPINVCGRMHDLIARNRVIAYREGDLMRHLHGESSPLPAAQRTAFEHHHPATGILAGFPLEAWPHLLAAMRRRAYRAGPWSGRLSKREAELAERILGELATRGPLGSDAFHDGRNARPFWGRATLAKSTLQKLFFHGRVLIARRDGIRRLYDLPSRVLPAEVLAAPEPDKGATARWLVLLKLRQRRLVTLKRDELPLVEDCVQPVQVADCPRLYCLREDVALFAGPLASEAAPEAAPSPRTVTLLAPLDPLVYDRVLTLRLWNFDYTWEVYTPPRKRVRGYYALPVLTGTELVGHVDPKIDRNRRRLVVVSRRVARGHRIADALAELRKFLQMRTG